jgi:hypothetical protein
MSRTNADIGKELKMAPHSSLRAVADWIAETPESIAARLAGAKESQSQLRLTIAGMAVISVMMLIAAYNAYLSYDYAWITEMGDLVVPDKQHQHRSDVLTEQALKDWAGSRTVQVSVLGVRVSVDDAAVLGSAVLLVMSLWLFLVVRRENHTIGFLLRDTDTHPASPRRDGQPDLDAKGQRWLIFHTILANSLFVTVDPSLAPVTSLNGDDAVPHTAFNEAKAWVNRGAFALIRYFFFSFPAITCLIVFGLDRWSYYIEDPFAAGYAVPGVGPFFWRSMGVFFVCWIPLSVCCWRSSQYSRATEKVLRAYGRKLGTDLRGHVSALDDDTLRITGGTSRARAATS